MTYGDGESVRERTLSNMTISFYPDYKIIEHELTLTAKNLAERKYYYEWFFSVKSEGLTIEEMN
jgi:hypothetical protein